MGNAFPASTFPTQIPMNSDYPKPAFQAIPFSQQLAFVLCAITDRCTVVPKAAGIQLLGGVYGHGWDEAGGGQRAQGAEVAAPFCQVGDIQAEAAWGY